MCQSPSHPYVPSPGGGSPAREPHPVAAHHLAAARVLVAAESVLATVPPREEKNVFTTRWAPSYGNRLGEGKGLLDLGLPLLIAESSLGVLANPDKTKRLTVVRK